LDESEKCRAYVSKFLETMNKKDIPENNYVSQNYVTFQEKKKKLTHYPVHLSSFIYAYARDYMWQHIFSKAKQFGGECYYTDTDSAVIKYRHMKYLKNQGLLVKEGELKKFGDFEIEKIIKKLIVEGPKFYCLETIEGEIKLRVKGVRPRDSLLLDVDGKVIVKKCLKKNEKNLKKGFVFEGKEALVENSGMQLLEAKLGDSTEINKVAIKTFAFYKHQGQLMFRDSIKFV